jgi:hypothetical protein
MGKLLSKLKEWFGYRKHSPQEPENQQKVSEQADEKWVIQPYIAPDEFYVTQTGQLIRQPVTRKKYYKARHRSRKRTK